MLLTLGLQKVPPLLSNNLSSERRGHHDHIPSTKCLGRVVIWLRIAKATAPIPLLCDHRSSTQTRVEAAACRRAVCVTGASPRDELRSLGRGRRSGRASTCAGRFGRGRFGSAFGSAFGSTFRSAVGGTFGGTFRSAFGGAAIAGWSRGGSSGGRACKA